MQTAHEIQRVVTAEITSDNQLAVVARHNHQGGNVAHEPSLGAVLIRGEVHDQKDLEQQQWHGQEPVHVVGF